MIGTHPGILGGMPVLRIIIEQLGPARHESSNWAVLSLGALDSEELDATDDSQAWVSEDIWSRMNDVSIDGDATWSIFTIHKSTGSDCCNVGVQRIHNIHGFV